MGAADRHGQAPEIAGSPVRPSAPVPFLPARTPHHPAGGELDARPAVAAGLDGATDPADGRHRLQACCCLTAGHPSGRPVAA